jgi:hypothetical protein
MNPKQFLLIGGAILLILGVVGLLPIFTEQNTPWFQLDSGENVAHIGLGVVALAAWYLLKDPNAQKWLVAVVGILGLATGLLGFVLPAGDEMHRNFFGLANLESPADNVLHLVVGVWALYAAFMGKAMMAPAKAM